MEQFNEYVIKEGFRTVSDDLSNAIDAMEEISDALIEEGFSDDASDIEYFANTLRIVRSKVATTKREILS